MGRKAILALMLALLGAYAYSLKRGESADASADPGLDSNLTASTDEQDENYADYPEDSEEAQSSDSGQDASESTGTTASSASTSPSSGYGVPSPTLAPRVSSGFPDDDDEDDDDALEEEIAARDAAAARERIRSREVRDDYSANAMPFLPLNPRSKRLAENWNFQAPGLSKEEIAPMLAQNQPKNISYFGDSGIMNITPAKNAQGTEQTDKTLNIASQGFITKTQNARANTIAKNAASGSTTNPSATPMPGTSDINARTTNTASISTLIRLPSDGFEIAEFRPGFRDDRETKLKPVADDLYDAIAKQDYDSKSWFNPKNPDEVKTYLTKILSLGHGGTLVLKVKNDGFISNEPGEDFALLENAFKTSGGNIYQEYGRVGVSDSLNGDVKWFPCNPQEKNVTWCFGAVSGDDQERIDLFDLSVIKVKSAKYIWIQDVGTNQNLSDGAAIPTEGCDLDYVRLDHAYSTK